MPAMAACARRFFAPLKAVGGMDIAELGRPHRQAGSAPPFPRLHGYAPFRAFLADKTDTA
ncbi:hypothetical protein AQ879_30580 [Burkholderia pseudomallei]|nr:hypothetical protein AQ879_30580 [Burkholderia pseudomallei]ONA39897.1 hypothetical protein AQ881_15700 [Burkholderia pseudomallei]ONB11775.1 hypothetical protein AQ894_23415 [Burkholderia pseudomallei]